MAFSRVHCAKIATLAHEGASVTPIYAAGDTVSAATAVERAVGEVIAVARIRPQEVVGQLPARACGNGRRISLPSHAPVAMPSTAYSRRLASVGGGGGGGGETVSIRRVKSVTRLEMPSRRSGDNVIRRGQRWFERCQAGVVPSSSSAVRR